MTPPNLDELYRAALAAHEKVKPTYEAYLAATTARKAAFRRLREAGESFGKMAKHLPMTATRIAQVVERKDPQ